VIAVRDLTVTLDDKTILNRVSFACDRGEVVCILGPNGAGKTTLLATLSALIQPTGGEILLEGADIRHLTRRQLARRIALVPQNHSPSFPFSVSEFVLTGRTPYLGLFESPTRQDRDVAAGWLKRLGIEHLAERPYTRISGGELRLCLIARALAQHPKILLLDEPTAHLDFKNRLTVLRIVKNLSRSFGITMVVSLHDPNELFLFADKALVLSEGCVVAFGEPHKVVTPELIEKIYGVEVACLTHEGVRIVVPRVKEEQNAEATDRRCDVVGASDGIEKGGTETAIP